MKFQNNGAICPICGKPRVSNSKGHIAGTPVHPECSKKMQEMRAQQKTKKKSTTKRLTDKAIGYFQKTDAYK